MLYKTRVEKIHSIATSGLNGASMMMKGEERLEIVKKKEERDEEKEARRRKKNGSMLSETVLLAAARNVDGQISSSLACARMRHGESFSGSLLLGTWPCT